MQPRSWSILFCRVCQEPTPPYCGMKTDHLGFVCDDCLNTEMEDQDGSPENSRHEKDQRTAYRA